MCENMTYIHRFRYNSVCFFFRRHGHKVQISRASVVSFPDEQL